MSPAKDGDESYFFDSYALFCIVKGQESYKRYTSNVKIITTMMNLYEVYYHLIKENMYHEAEIFFDRFEQYCVPLYPKAIKEASRFRLANTKAGLSFIEALGYVIAQQHRIKFLTGDKAFQKMPNVMFVK